MKVVTVVGLRNSREAARATHLAEFLIDQGTKLTRTTGLALNADFAGTTVRLAFSQDDSLSRLIADSFFTAPTSRGSQPPGHSITVIRASDGVVVPNLEWAQPWISSNEVIPRSITGRYRLFIDRNHGLIYAYDTRTQTGSVYLRPTAALDIRTLITPFRVLWSWVSQSWDGLVLHAAAVGVDGVGVLLSGPSGSGKSTLALTAGTGPNSFIVSDDCVIMIGTTAHAVFTRAKKVDSSENLDLAPEVNVIRGRGRAKKTICLPSEVDSFQQSTKIGLMLFPHVFGRPGHYPLTATEARERLSGDSFREVLGGDEWQQQQIATLTESVPAHRLLLGPSDTENLDNLRALVANPSVRR